jgi:hypothetical protein
VSLLSLPLSLLVPLSQFSPRTHEHKPAYFAAVTVVMLFLDSANAPSLAKL